MKTRDWTWDEAGWQKVVVELKSYGHKEGIRWLVQDPHKYGIRKLGGVVSGYEFTVWYPHSLNYNEKNLFASYEGALRELEQQLAAADKRLKDAQKMMRKLRAVYKKAVEVQS